MCVNGISTDNQNPVETTATKGTKPRVKLSSYSPYINDISSPNAIKNDRKGKKTKKYNFC